MAIYKPKGSKIYWYEFVFNGQRIRESTKSTVKEVAIKTERARRRQLEENYNGIEKVEPQKTFSAAAEETLTNIRGKIAKNTMAIRERDVKRLNPFIGKKLLRDINMQDIEAFRADRRKHGDGNRYINMSIETLRLVMIRYQQWQRLGKDYKKLPERTDVGKELSSEQEEKLLNACRASFSRELYPAVVLGLYGGLRHDEVRLLHWSQIDLEKGCVTVGPSKTLNGEGRLVPLIGPAFDAMKEWAAAFPNKLPNHFVFPEERYAVKSKCKSGQNL